MTTTVSSNNPPRRSWFAAKIAGFALVGLGVFAGGCNNAMKDENAALMQENAALRERVTQMETNQAAMQQQLAARQPTNFDDGGWSQPTGRTGERTRTAPRETVIPISGDILFDSGQATLKSTAKKDLDKVVAQIRQHQGATVRIEGHTDTDPIRKSNWPSNEALSKARADAVRDYLVSKGVSRSAITTVGMGAAQPKGTKAASRRVEVVIVDSY
ncbi:MAG: OmpA family protein [Phycisphaeraceae bacterium]|nr:OmpA family protein [Phycisphaeraceae bacterium]MBX3406854.1 OmpA family protein [Phycisphaeraceae bacterium]